MNNYNSHKEDKITITDNDVIKYLKEIPNIEKSYLVGGAVRDIVLKKNIKDYDLVVQPDFFSTILQGFVDSKASVFCLDKARNYYRIITYPARKGQTRLQIDIISLEANDLKTDLSYRDFTINAIALPMKYFITGEVYKDNFFDPFNGMVHLDQKFLAPVLKNKTFRDDPARIIRAFRFMSQGFLPVKGLYSMIEQEKSGLKSIPSERIFQELFPILEDDELKERLGETKQDFITLNKMSELDLWGVIFSSEGSKNEKNRLFSTFKLSQELLLELEKWFSEITELIQGELFGKDLTYFKWLVWFSIFTEAQHEDKTKLESGFKVWEELSDFLWSFNYRFPVPKKQKNYACHYIEGYRLQENYRNEESLTKLLAKSILAKVPDTAEKEYFFVLGQVSAVKLKSLKSRVGEKSYDREYDLLKQEIEHRLEYLKHAKGKLWQIRKEIDGEYVLSFFDRVPGPWLSDVLSRVHYSLLVDLLQKSNLSDELTHVDIKALGKKAILKIKESEGLGGERYS